MLCRPVNQRAGPESAARRPVVLRAIALREIGLWRRSMNHVGAPATENDAAPPEAQRRLARSGRHLEQSWVCERGPIPRSRRRRIERKAMIGDVCHREDLAPELDRIARSDLRLERRRAVAGHRRVALRHRHRSRQRLRQRPPHIHAGRRSIGPDPYVDLGRHLPRPIHPRAGPGRPRIARGSRRPRRARHRISCDRTRRQQPRQQHENDESLPHGITRLAMLSHPGAAFNRIRSRQ